jgi:hypothetical protein
MKPPANGNGGPRKEAAASMVLKKPDDLCESVKAFWPSEALRQEMVRRDIQTASIHEAGHIVAALNNGVVVASGRIFKRNNGDLLDLKSVGGWARSHQHLTKMQDAVVGFAGVAAELLAEDPSMEAWEVLDVIDECQPSESDWRSINRIHPSWHGRALARCVETLKAKWSEVERCADILVRSYQWHADIEVEANCYDGACYFTKEILSMETRK